MSEEEKSLDVELYGEEIARLQSDLAEMDSLYADSKTMMQAIAKSAQRGRGGGVAFVHQQTANLVALKSSQLQIVKTIIDAKTKKFGNQIKALGEEKEEGDIPYALVRMILEKFPSNNGSADELEQDEDGNIIEGDFTDVDDELDQALIALEGEEEDETSDSDDEDEETEEDEDDAEVVADENGKWYVTNSDMEDISDQYQLPDYPAVIEDRNGDIVALDADNVEYRVIDPEFFVE